MRVLLDECLPKRLKITFQVHQVSTVPEVGWAGKTNGELLKLAETKFDAFVTVDQNLQYQQNLAKTKMAIVLIVVQNNRYDSFKPLVHKIQKAFDSIQKGQVIRIEA